jgi:peptide/nickel transport system substrate-binding protein
MIAGESDFQYRYVDQQKLTIFMLNRDKSGYRVSMVPSRRMDASIIINMTYDLDPELAKWYRTKDFRRALAISIDRQTINNAIYFGMGEIGGYSPPSFSYYKLGPEWATKHGTYEPKVATALLDGLGLKKDSEGFYLRSDGKGRLRPVLRAHPGGGGSTNVHVNYSTIVVENWREIGIDAVLKVAPAPDVKNHEQIAATTGDTDPWLAGIYPVCSYEVTAFIDTKGAEGIDPNSREELKPCAKAWELHKLGSQATSRLEQVNYAKQLIELTVDNIYGIGIVKGNPSGKGQMLILNKDIRNVLNQPRTDRHAFRMELYFFDTFSGDSETH